MSPLQPTIHKVLKSVWTYAKQKQIANGSLMIPQIPRAACTMNAMILLVVTHAFQEITSVLKIQKVNNKIIKF